MVGRRAGLVVGCGLHLLEDLLGELLVADTAKCVDDGTVCYAGRADTKVAHLSEVEQAVVDAASLAKLANEGIVEE